MIEQIKKELEKDESGMYIHAPNYISPSDLRIEQFIRELDYLLLTNPGSNG